MHPLLGSASPLLDPTYPHDPKLGRAPVDRSGAHHRGFPRATNQLAKDMYFAA